jgi:putative FmdB family regulatory protein
MPLYEYECEKGHRFEVIQKFSDPLVTVCPTCGSVVHKLMSSPAIQFKGSGWYITDYAKKDSAGAGRAGKTASSDESGATAGGDAAKGEKAKNDAGTSSTTKGDTAKSDTTTSSGTGHTAKTDGGKSDAKPGSGGSTGSTS